MYNAHGIKSMTLFEKFQFVNRMIAYLIFIVIGMFILMVIGSILLYDNALSPMDEMVTTSEMWKGFAIVEYTDGSVKNSVDDSVRVLKFDPIKEKSRQYMVYKRHGTGISLNYLIKNDYTSLYYVTGFVDSNGIPIIGVISTWENDLWTPNIVTNYYRQYGPNWPDNVFKQTKYYPTLYTYVKSKTAMQLLNTQPWYSPDDSIGIHFRPADTKLFRELDDKRGMNLIPHYLTDDAGESYINNLDYTDVMTKTSPEFVKDTIVQSHKIY